MNNEKGTIPVKVHQCDQTADCRERGYFTQCTLGVSNFFNKMQATAITFALKIRSHYFINPKYKSKYKEIKNK